MQNFERQPRWVHSVPPAFERDSRNSLRNLTVKLEAGQANSRENGETDRKAAFYRPTPGLHVGCCKSRAIAASNG